MPESSWRSSRELPPTLAEAAASRLMDAIVTGELPPGTRLRLAQLADSLGMSISPVREALRELEALGLVESEVHRGGRVAQLTLEDLRDTYEARLDLEVRAVSRAAERFTEADAAEAARNLNEYRRALRRSERAARNAHTEFHFTLYRASGSAWLVRLITPVWRNAERYRLASLPRRGDIDRRRDEHEQILQACIRHDPTEAENALWRHLALTANLVSRQMGSENLFPEVFDPTELPRIAGSRG